MKKVLLILFLSALGLQGAEDTRAQGGTIHESPHKKLKRSCEKCHVATSFREIRFGHQATSFPLEGHHATAPCLACHNVEDFSKVESDCVTCHEDVHRDRLGDDCARCHSADGWSVIDAEEVHAETNFPLLGRHLMIDCEACHPGSAVADFRETRTRCFDCHEQDYLGVTSPDHQGSGFSTECQNCHEMTGWVPSHMPDHDIFFPIFSGSHQGAWSACSQCHVDPSNQSVFECITCHRHNQTDTDFSHQGLDGYSYTSAACYSCHPTGEAGRFGDHDGQFFPIFSGTHLGQWSQCSDCHVDPGNRQVFECINCHAHEPTETDGFHQGFPGYSYTSAACLECHPDGRKGQFLTHDAAFFPVFSGTHRSAWTECTECHTVPGNRSAFECIECHAHPQTTTDAAHNGFAGYAYSSPACLECHPTGEAGDMIDHDTQFFPIYSGTHQNEWSQCADCHVDPSNRKVFECINCHAHEPTETNGFHEGFPGYSYTSTACLNCHPDGRKGQFVAHDAAFFPVFSGTHRGTWADCSECHTVPGDRSAFECIECHEHAQATTDQFHNGFTGYAYNSPACLGCHPTGERGAFTDHDPFFPITSGRHSNYGTCATCHEVPSDRSQFTCFNCHEHSQSRADSQHIGEVSGYVYDSDRCYDCHPRGRAD